MIRLGAGIGTGVLPRLLAVFWACGFCTVLVNGLAPAVRALFGLSHAQAMLTQSCYFGAYFVCALPAGWLIGRTGYLNTIAVGLSVMAAGGLALAGAAGWGSYGGVLAALFALACGVTLVQVGMNPAMALAGPAAGATRRLNLAQGLNALAGMVAPLAGAGLIMGQIAGPPAALSHRNQAVGLPFAAMAAVLAVLAAWCWAAPRWIPAGPQRGNGAGTVMRQRRVMLGAVTIFAYVGAEIAVGGSIAEFLMRPEILGAAPVVAGRLVSLYWGGAMLGRFGGAFIPVHLPRGLVLAGCAAGSAMLATGAALSHGPGAAAALLAVGLFNAIQFPTIFTLSIEGLGERTAQASGLLCMAIVGGALVPLAAGMLADARGLGMALLVPVACYGWIMLWGLAMHRAGHRAHADRSATVPI